METAELLPKNTKDVQRKESSRQGFFFQPRLTVNDPNDAYEQDADDTANKVMRMAVPVNENSSFPATIAPLQRKYNSYEEEDKPIRRKENPDSEIPESSELYQYISSLSSSGQPLPDASRHFFEPRFGQDFSNVRIHNDSVAAKSAQSINALAYTSGSDIVFNHGQYSPGTESGQRLLAHELTHVSQQGEMIRRWPKDPFGRPVGHFSTPEQEMYDKELFKSKEWYGALDRLDKGELDDRDLEIERLRIRLTGLTTNEINALIAKIQNHQKKNPKLSVVRIIEWLEVRKEISTPMRDGATVIRDPITRSIESYSFKVNNVRVTVLKDTYGNTKNATGLVTSFGRNYKWQSNSKNIINKLTADTDNGIVAINPTSFDVIIQTKYHDNPNDESGYGKGTEESDKTEKTTTLRVHEGKHGTDYIDFISKNPFPVDISNGVVDVLTVAEMKKAEKYISDISKDTVKLTDQVGFTMNEYLKKEAGGK
ncbi:MAG: DUF4157 domain-containing protein [Bacteroidetes bacterium]|nr:DUF4157 domain-containing protein [Bacteroidota bacterium]